MHLVNFSQLKGAEYERCAFQEDSDARKILAQLARLTPTAASHTKAAWFCISTIESKALSMFARSQPPDVERT